MKIKSVLIKNFRSIKEINFSLKDLSIFIGNNGTGKTSILEAINFALSPHFLSGRIKHTDFYNGTDEPIIIEIEFSDFFKGEIPDGFTKQVVPCNKVHLEIKKRQKATPNKSFTDGFVINHYVVPVQPPKNDNGWEIIRKTSGKPFQFTTRTLSLSYIELNNFIRSFYFAKNRAIQIKKEYNSSLSSVFDDFNWRFIKGLQDSEEKSQVNFQSKKNRA